MEAQVVTVEVKSSGNLAELVQACKPAVALVEE